jgi:hypothetical protein
VFGLDKADAYRRQKITVANCLDCQACMKACPQKIEIPSKLRQAAELWDPRFGSLIVQPALEKVAADGTATMSLQTHNFAPTVTSVQVDVEQTQGVKLASTSAQAGAMAAFERRSFAFAGVVDPAGDRIQMQARAAAHGQTAAVQAEFRYLLVPAQSDEEWNGGTWHSFGPKEGSFTRDAATAARHGVRFRLVRDPEALVLLADVRDDFLYPSRVERDKGTYNVDMLELYLDGRAAARCGHPGYEDGVWQIFLYPGPPVGGGANGFAGGAHAAFYHAKAALDLEVQSFATASGYRLKARIPFAAFATAPAPLRKIGFDLALNTANAAGERVGQFAFAGDSDNWQDASKFATAWLV